jgi:hypothetical protein
MKKILSIIIIAVLFYSCSSVKEQQSELNADFKELSKVTADNLEFTGRVKLDLDGQSYSLSTDIYCASEDSVLMILKAFMGIPAAKMYSNPDYFLAYNALENKAFVGEPTKENIEKAVKIALSYNDMISLLRNIPNMAMDYKISEEGTNSKEILYYRYFNDKYIEYVKYNTEQNYISQYQQKSSDNKLLLNVFFEEPKLVGKRNMPFKITAVLPEAKSSVSFNFDEIKIVEKFDKEFNFSVPQNVTKIKL